jgi:hypothetical protein
MVGLGFIYYNNIEKLIKIIDNYYFFISYKAMLIIVMVLFITFILIIALILFTGPNSGSNRPFPPRRPQGARGPRRPGVRLGVPDEEVLREWLRTDSSIILSRSGRTWDLLFLKLAIQIGYSFNAPRFNTMSIYSRYWPVYGLLEQNERLRVSRIAQYAQYTGALERSGYTLYNGQVRRINGHIATPTFSLLFVLITHANAFNRPL